MAGRLLVGFDRARAKPEGVNLVLFALDDFGLVNIES